MNIIIVISYLIAIIVPLIAIYLISVLDLFATGKRSTIIVAFAWGALGAFGLAYLVNSLAVRIFQYTLVVGLTAPIVEEIIKSSILVYFIRQARFRYFVDGAIYGFAVGIGFAVTENLFYLSSASNTGLALSISRVLSTTLMHATASSIVGIALGHLRRSQHSKKAGWSVLGIALAITLHVIYNNLVGTLTGALLLLVAIGMGIGGGVMIALIINQGLSDEKRHFEQTLGIGVGVSTGERKAVQQLGSEAIDKVLAELASFFGADKIEKIRRVLIIHANIGILQNNLRNPVSDRLRTAWQQEIATLRAESDQMRRDLGVYVMSFLRGVFPPDELATGPFSRAMANSDPTVIHTFDVFMALSERSQTISPSRLTAIAETLKKVEFFKDVELADLENLSRAIVTRTYGDGEVLFSEGDEGDAMFLIQQGEIDLLTTVDGQKKLLRTSQVGDVVGELALLDGQPRSARAQARGALTVLMLRREQFIMFLNSRPAVILAVLQFLARRVRHVTEIVETSASWATQVAQGNYARARTIGALAPEARSQSAEAWLDNNAAEPSLPTGLDDISADATVRLRGAFASITTALERREQSAQQKLTETVPALLSISTLPPEQQEVMKFLMKDQIALSQGITLELLQVKLPHLLNISDLVDDLVKQDWVSTVEAAPHVRYRVNLKRKRSKPVSLFKNVGKPGD